MVQKDQRDSLIDKVLASHITDLGLILGSGHGECRARNKHNQM